MTKEIIDTLKNTIGRRLTNHEWIELVSEDFKVSNSVAKKMIHAMYEIARAQKYDS